MLVDIQESSVTIEESKEPGFLGKLKGVFFVPDGFSRNKRFYPKELWEKVIADSDVQERINNRQMFGTISHSQPLDDKALLEGKMSHIISSISINESGEGIGEALILDTPAGRTLNTIVRAGCKVFVSSRADGSFKGEHKGVPVVDKDSYRLKTWDIVLDPGFLEANPAVVEDLNKVLEEPEITKPQKELYKMDPKFTENLMTENNSLKANLTDMSEFVKNSEAAVAVSNSKLEDSLKVVEETREALKSFEAIGTIEDVLKKLEDLDAKEKEVAELKEAAEADKKTIENFEALGNADDIEKVFNATEKTNEVLSAYEALGTVEEFEKVVEALEVNFDKQEAAESEVKIESLAKELNVSKEVIEAVYGKMKEEEIKTFVKGIANSSSWTPKDEDLNNDRTNEPASKDESEKTSPSDKPRATRIMESMYRFSK